jgi:hypothetical protein
VLPPARPHVHITLGQPPPSPQTPPKAASGFLNAAALVLVDWLVDKGVLVKGGFALGTRNTGSFYYGFIQVTMQVRMGGTRRCRSLPCSLMQCCGGKACRGPCALQKPQDASH